MTWFARECLSRSNRCLEVEKMVPIKQIMATALEMDGDDYVFGVENDGKPVEEIEAEDCSELVQNVCDLNHVVPRMPDGAINQYYHCRNQGTLIPIAKALQTYGALFFRITPETGNHVAFSLGNGKTFEARGRAYGVGSWSAEGRPWTHAALIPGADYSQPKEA